MKPSSPVRSTLWLTSEKILSMVLTLVVTFVVARHLGVDAFGRLSYLLAIIGLITPLAALGLHGIVTRELVLRSACGNTILGTALALRLVGYATCGAIAWLLAPWLVPKETEREFAILLTANVFTAFLVFDSWLQAHVMNSYAAKLRFVVLAITSVTRLTAAAFDASLAVFVWIASAELAFTGAAFLAFYATHGGTLHKLRVTLDETKRLLRQSWWLLLSGVAAVVYLKIDQVMLGQLQSEREVGIYAVAVRLSEVWYFFPTALVVSFFPTLIKIREENPEKYRRQLQKLNDLLFAAAFLLAVITTLLGEPIITFLFGEEYSRSSQVLSIHIWASIFVFMRALLSKWLLAENLLVFSFVTQAAGAGCNVVLNLVLIPEHGATGAAVATILSYAVASYVSLFLHRQTWIMASICTRSLLLPLRAIKERKQLYSTWSIYE